MQTITERQIREAISSTGVTPGSLVFVHSALLTLGPIAGAPIDEMPSRIYKILRQHLGPRGTIAVPTFNFEFCDGCGFHRQHTPSQGMGVFSEYLRRLPDARRSPHPMQSMAAVGPLSKNLAERDTPSAFEEGSSFDALLEYDATILMLGCGINAVSLVHWAEEKVGVPYRYWKSFSGHYRDGRWAGHRTYRLFARDLELDPEVRVEPVGEVLRRRAEIHRVELGRGTIEACSARHFAAAALQLLRRDPRALIRSEMDHRSRRPRATG